MKTYVEQSVLVVVLGDGDYDDWDRTIAALEPACLVVLDLRSNLDPGESVRRAVSAQRHVQAHHGAIAVVLSPQLSLDFEADPRLASNFASYPGVGRAVDALLNGEVPQAMAVTV